MLRRPRTWCLFALLVLPVSGWLLAAEGAAALKKWQRGKGWGWVWGADDEVGSLNEMTDASRLAATKLVTQGKTYDRAIVDLGSRAFSPGQTYVALSRIRSLEGMYLTRPLHPRDIFVDDDVLRFMRQVSAARATASATSG